MAKHRQQYQETIGDNKYLNPNDLQNFTVHKGAYSENYLRYNYDPKLHNIAKNK